jgi:RNA polymerase sigma-70 factor (ECF subfamily)
MRGEGELHEQQLIERARRGDSIAMSQLMRDNYALVYGYLLKVTRDQETAKDVTQEAMTRSLVAIRLFRGESKFSSWLIQIAYHAYLDEREKWEKRTVHQETEQIAPVSTEQEAMRHEQVDQIQKALLEIDEPDRSIFLLKHEQGYTYRELADLFDLKEGTIRSKLHYTIKKIQKKVREPDEDMC